jgi:tRNA pseudouridine55 synthase
MDFIWDQVSNLNEDWSDIESWHAGKILLLDKPLDWTSFDLVGKVKVALKYKLGIRKIKLGHGGTLDPKATGLMVLLTGRYTKLTERIHGLDKTYIAEIFLGATTPCYDTERPVDQYYSTEHISKEQILNSIEKFKGNIIQFPPVYSAVKIKGRAAYKSAHKGIEIETRPRNQIVYRFEILDLTMPILKVLIQCSSGTYIRSLAHDLGKELQSGAYLHSLIRTEIGHWSLSDAMKIDDVLAKMENDHSPIVV